MTNRLTALSVALMAGASLHAVDVDQAQGGLVIGNDTAKDSYKSVHVGLANKQIDQGWARSEDAVLQGGGTIRQWGLGLSAEAAMAVAPDRGAAELDDTDPTTYQSRPIDPGEIVQLNVKVDYVLEIEGIYGENQPFLQLIPHFEYVTYPNQQGNDLKDHQLWAGADTWWSTPLEGVDIGGGVDWNLGGPGFRGAFGGREFFQFAPYDLQFWQLANFGDQSYRSYFVDTDKRGWTTSQLGAKVMIPTAWREWWTTVKTDWTYWLKGDDQDYRKAMGLDRGDFTFSVGLQWIAE